MSVLTLKKPIPTLATNEKAAFGPVNLNDFIAIANGEVHFSAELKGGGSLPQGLICTTDGILTGIPAKGTEGNYEVSVLIVSGGERLQVDFMLMIKPGLSTDANYIDKLKTQIWEAVEQHLPIPDLAEMYERPISAADLYYLLERWGVLTIWDAYNLDAAGEKHLLTLENMNPHYHIYDRGSSLIGCPKDLFSHERTLADALQTAKVMAKEVFKRRWTIEMAGFDKMQRAAWVELQHLEHKHGVKIEVLNYQYTPEDVKVYRQEVMDEYKNKFDQGLE